MLVEKVMEDMAFEAVVLRHSEALSSEAVEVSSNYLNCDRIPKGTKPSGARTT